MHICITGCYFVLLFIFYPFFFMCSCLFGQNTLRSSACRIVKKILYPLPKAHLESISSWFCILCMNSSVSLLSYKHISVYWCSSYLYTKAELFREVSIWAADYFLCLTVSNKNVIIFELSIHPNLPPFLLLVTVARSSSPQVSVWCSAV